MSQINVYNPNGIGIEENIESTFNVFPNPAGEFIVLNTSENYSQEVFVSIYNIAGQILFTRNYMNTGNISIELNDISSGVYFVKVDDGINRMTKKFIKN